MMPIAVTGLLLVCLVGSAVESRGSTWPLPAKITSSTNVFGLNRNSFRFGVTGVTCDILDEALVRYFRIIFDDNPRVNLVARSKQRILRFLVQPQLTRLDVKLQNPCEVYPSMGMDESYFLTISSSGAQLTAPAIWGALRGLETFSQLIHYSSDGNLQVNGTDISDKPRFSWRGILLDTSRHFLSKEIILQNLDAMAYNKINVFHWHIVDDQSFPYQSKKFPDMSDKGAYEPYTHVYTQTDVHEIIQYARLRGIRVVPEFDSPGHSQSWGKAVADLLTKCYSGGKFSGNFGPIDPSVETTYQFLNVFVDELTEVFKDHYLHLGGDEVDFSCWKSNPNITDFMAKMAFGTDYTKLESYYIAKLLEIVDKFKAGAVVWQEVFDNGVKVHPDTVIEVWKSGLDKVAAVTATGLRAIYSTSWYLDYINYGADWRNYYKVDPLNFNGTDAQKALVMGGEACLWAEYVDATNVESRLWPRASAIAERLWSPQNVTDMNSANVRMEEHRCRMVRRGINAEPPSGPGFCEFEARSRGKFNF